MQNEIISGKHSKIHIFIIIYFVQIKMQIFFLFSFVLTKMHYININTYPTKFELYIYVYHFNIELMQQIRFPLLQMLFFLPATN